MTSTRTVRFRVYGIVQGVGFRPTVDRHAQTARIRGSVCNKGPYVEIFAQGTPDQIKTFETLLNEQPPRRAAILKIDEKPVEDAPAFDSFSIVESEKTSGEIYISPDIAICEECERELYDPSNRRYLHPFINCTCCGPRMTILDALPYDRERTSMKMFPMCRPCAEEYYGAWSRRYDAQPVCCNDCGPEVYLLPAAGEAKKDLRSSEESPVGHAGKDLPSLTDSPPSDVSVYRAPAAAAGSTDSLNHRKTTRGGVEAGIIGRQAITAARRAILNGGIVAVKGIGGFHLCCDATSEEAVQRLRKRKRRPAKPFAVMMKDEAVVRRECIFNEEQYHILTGHQKPILLLDRKQNVQNIQNIQDAQNKQKVQDTQNLQNVYTGTASSGQDGPAGHPADTLHAVHAGGGPLLAPSVAPGNPKVGVMLPYAPLQHLLFTYDDGLQMPDCLVMTSGNVSGAPICRDDNDALSELSAFCDCILSHDRMIRIRADDSVMDFHRGEPYMIRRSRGYAPLPVLLTPEDDPDRKAQRTDKYTQRTDKNTISPENTGTEHAGLPKKQLLSKEMEGCVLAVGGELKNTFCIASGNLFYLSPYVGDLEDLRTVRALQETIERMETLLEVTPGAVVCDLHPKYNATMVAEDIAEKRNIPLIRIQHHYAHVLSCMAENDCSEKVIGVSFDGTGYGTDGTIWGGEILTADYHGFEREYSIAPFTQIGGDSAPRQGWRIAASMIWNYCRNQSYLHSGSSPVPEESQQTQIYDPAEHYFSIMDQLSVCDPQNAKVQRMMAEKKLQAVTSTSAGRLFDSVSAMLGICRESTYEGEASIELEFAAERYAEKCKNGRVPDPGQEIRKIRQALSFDEDAGHLPTDTLFAQLLERRLLGEDPEKLAYFFHVFLAELAVEACIRVSRDKGIRTAALTGGCYQNRLLLTLTEDSLKEAGFRVLIHHLVPPNDGGIALGQAAAVMMRLQTQVKTELPEKELQKADL